MAIDNFGGPDAGLGDLAGLAIDELKLDASLIRDLERGKTDVAIVRSVQALASGLGITVVATGVQTTKQLNVLRSADVEQYQGGPLNRPQKAGEFTVKWLLPGKPPSR